jgi:hypothetical protein
MLLHDKVHLHTWTVAHTQALLEHFNRELFDHPSYSLDLALSDDLFTCLKSWLGSQRFNNNEELMEDVRIWQSSQAADFFGTGIQKHIPQCGKCLSSSGDFIEK